MENDRRKDVKLRKALNKLRQIADNHRIIQTHGADIPSMIWKKSDGDRLVTRATMIHLDILPSGDHLVCISPEGSHESHFGLIEPFSNYLFTELSITELAQECDRYSLIKAVDIFKYYLGEYEFNQERKRK